MQLRSGWDPRSSLRIMRIAFCQEVHLAPVRTSLWAAGLLVKKRTSSFSDSRGHNYLRTSLVLLDMHIRHVPLFSPSCRCKVTQPTYQFFFFFFLFSPPDFAHEVGKGSVEFLLEGIVRFGERSFAKKKKTNGRIAWFLWRNVDWRKKFGIDGFKKISQFYWHG